MSDRRKREMTLLEERRSSGRDRRVAQRYPAGGTKVLISWSGDEGYETLVASLKDISLSGAALLADSLPPREVPLWFRVTGDESSEWVGVSVVGVSKTGVLGLGPRLVRLRFKQTCPYLTFKTAIEGFSQDVQCHEQMTGKFTNRDWR